RRHVGARRARLIRHRRRRGAALASPATEERAAAGLLFIRLLRVRLFLLRLPRSLALPPYAGGGIPKLSLPRAPPTRRASRGAWGRGRTSLHGRHCRRHLRLRAMLDDRTMILAGERILPLEGVEPAAHRRDRQPVIGDESVRGPGRIAPRVERARHPFAR